MEQPWFPSGFDLAAHQRAQGRHADAILTALADVQHGVVTARQLRALGVGAERIRGRLGSGLLHPYGRGIYLVARRRLTPTGRHMAGVLAAGRGALLADLSAAAQLRTWPGTPPAVHIVVPPGRRVQRRGIAAREATILPHERTLVDGIPCLTPARLFLDVAAHRERRTLESVWHEGIYRRLVHTADIRQVLEDHAGEPGTVVLRRLYERRCRAVGDVANRLEAAMREIIVEAGMPEPRANMPLVLEGVRLRPDLYVPERRLVFETDGRDGHEDPERVLGDERRDELYGRAGLSSFRYGWWVVHHERPRVLGDLQRYEAAWRRTGGRWTPAEPRPAFVSARRPRRG